MRLLSDHDADTVLVVLSKRLYACTLTVSSDAVSSDTLIHQHLGHSISTAFSDTVVDDIVTSTGISITCNGHLSIRMLVEIIDEMIIRI